MLTIRAIVGALKFNRGRFWAASEAPGLRYLEFLLTFQVRRNGSFPVKHMEIPLTNVHISMIFKYIDIISLLSGLARAFKQKGGFNAL